MLRVNDLVAGYGDAPILKGVSITAKAGEITTIIGPNGAGKSTLLKAIFNLVTPMTGRIYFSDQDITGLPSHQLVRLGISFLMQRRTVFLELTVEENLEMALWKYRSVGKSRSKALEKVYELFPMLVALRTKPAYLLSGGEQRIVELARILLQDPKLVLVDEPTAGLSPKLALKIYDLLVRLKKNGAAVLMVDQNVKYAIQYSDRLYVMVNGYITTEYSGKILSSSLKEIVNSWFKHG